MYRDLQLHWDWDLYFNVLNNKENDEKGFVGVRQENPAPTIGINSFKSFSYFICR